MEFVHQPNKDDELYQHNLEIYKLLNKNNIVSFCCVADYTKNSKLYNTLNRL